MEDKGHQIRLVARKLFIFFRSQERIAGESEIEGSWLCITEKVKKEKAFRLRRRIYMTIGVAASLALLAGISFYSSNKSTNSDNIRCIASRFNPETMNENEIVLAVSEKQHIQVDNDAKVSYRKDGTVNIGSQTINKETSAEKTNYNQITVPKGKRTELDLSDGSKLWVNAGSRVIYPPQFTQNNREIYVEGEIYLEVAHDPSHPFIVKTAHFDVEVLGTKFNINAYKNDESEVVLAQGSVRIKNEQKEEILLSPNQMAKLDQNNTIEVVNVNASEYTCWANGLLSLHATPITTVLNKLKFYYGKNISFDESIKDIPLSGKLDLKENLDDVLRLISTTAPVIYEKKDDSYIIRRKP